MPLYGAVWANDRDLASFGFQVEEAAGALGVMSSTLDAQPMAGAVGRAVTSAELNIDARPVAIRGMLEGTSQADYRAKLEKLVYFLKQGTIEIRTAHDPDYVLLVRWRSHSLPISVPQFVSTWGKGELLFEAVVAYPVERAGLSYGITTNGSAGRVAIPVGSAPSLWSLQICNGNTPVFSVYDDRGEIVGSMTFGLYVGSLDYIGIERHTERIAKSLLNGGQSDASDILQLGDRWIDFRPQYADIANSSTLYVELSSGRGWLKVRRLKVT